MFNNKQYETMLKTDHPSFCLQAINAEAAEIPLEAEGAFDSQFSRALGSNSPA